MNIIRIFNQFPTHESCVAHLENVRWKGTPQCPHCKSENTYTLKETDRRTSRHHCNGCRKSFSVLVGTIFEDTRLPLQKWFLAISLILNAKKGISARQLARDLEVNKDTAWSMAMRIRDAMRDDGFLLSGIIEADECYIGGKPRKGNKKDDDNNSPRGRGTKKIPVVGMVERGGKVKAMPVQKSMLNSKTLLDLVRKTINKNGSVLLTDEYRGYNGVQKHLKHYRINHQVNYVTGQIHTNTIESFWALLKRGIIGQFHKVSAKYLSKYVDEFCFRYNLRNNDPRESFNQFLHAMVAG